jgi:hypothetical protein
MVGSAVRASDRIEKAEPTFIEAVGRWSRRNGVDRRTLSRLGVERRVLDAAGLHPTPVADLIRQHYGEGPFSIAEVALRSALSDASVRQTVYADDDEGTITSVGKRGKTVLYKRVG